MGLRENNGNCVSMMIEMHEATEVSAGHNGSIVLHNDPYTILPALKLINFSLV